MADLRQDLMQAQQQAAAQPASIDEVLRLGVEEVTVTLEVAHERTLSGETSGKVGAKFWVFASAEAAVNAGAQSKRSAAQTLTLTLRPRLETTVTDPEGRSVTTVRGVDVEGRVAAHEQLSPAPKL